MGFGNVYDSVAKYRKAENRPNDPGDRNYDFQVGWIDIRIVQDRNGTAPHPNNPDWGKNELVETSG